MGAIIKITKSQSFDTEVNVFLNEVLDEVAETLKTRIKRGAPKDTGKLAKSIEIEKTKNKREIGTKLAYGEIQEFGGSNGRGTILSAQPYFRPAIKSIREIKDNG